jgi:hypothetical protein
MATLAADSVVKRNPDIMVAQVPDGYVMLSVDASRYLEFNATAAAVWDLLETPRTVRSLCEAVQMGFEVEAGRCQTEVHDLLTQLIRVSAVRIDE